MTDLTAPPIAAGVKHPYWRQKDTWGPPFVEAGVSVFADTTVPTGSGTNSHHTYGTGTTGKVLHVYDGFSWIPVPVGYGEPGNMASFNVFNKKTSTWHTPDWIGREEYRDQSRFAFDVRVKNNQTYDARSGQNTNYSPGGSEYAPQHDGYLRLFYTRERPDPEWRVFNLLRYFPTHSPSTMVQLTEYTDFIQRGGRIGTSASTYYDNEPTYVQGPYYMPYDAYLSRSYIDYLGSDLNTLAAADITRGLKPVDRPGPVLGHPLNQYYSQWAGMLDLAAIKKQMTAIWPNRNPDWTGQYDHMLLNHTQRIYIAGYVVYTVSWSSGLSAFVDLTQYLRGITFRLYQSTNYPGSLIPSTASYINEYEPRWPTDALPSGNVIVEQIGVPGAYVHDPFDLSNTYTITYQRPIAFNLTGPGEDNLRFSATIDNVPYAPAVSQILQNNGSTTSVLYPDTLSASMRFVPQQIYLTYALPGRDASAYWLQRFQEYNMGSATVGSI